MKVMLSKSEMIEIDTPVLVKPLRLNTSNKDRVRARINHKGVTMFAGFMANKPMFITWELLWALKEVHDGK
jgi:hypothetical protein